MKHDPSAARPSLAPPTAGDAPDPGRDPVEALAAEFVDRLRRGEPVSVEAYARRYPDLAAEVRDLFPTIAALEGFKSDPQGPPSGAAPGAPERLGDLRIVRELGRGGMGVVYEAEQESLARRVAVKVLPERALGDPRRLERFLREARTAAALSHPGIVPIYSIGQDQGLHYLVMQRIEGVGLDREIDRAAGRWGADRAAPTRSMAGAHTPGAATRTASPPTPDASRPGAPPSAAARGESPLTGPDRWRTVAEVGRQAAEALAYAHAQGVTHRDIKPANLLIDRAGRVWVSDFGLAKAYGAVDLSHTGELVGTLRYMAPEQFSGPATPRSDIYSLGVTLYELATLCPPFDAPAPSQVIGGITTGRAPLPRTLEPGVPRGLEAVILKAMALDPAARYASAGDLARDLARWLAGGAPAAPSPSRWRQGLAWVRQNRVAVGLGALLAALTLGGVLVVALMLGPPLPPGAGAMRDEAGRPFGAGGFGPPPWDAEARRNGDRDPNAPEGALRGGPPGPFVERGARDDAGLQGRGPGWRRWRGGQPPGGPVADAPNDPDERLRPGRGPFGFGPPREGPLRERPRGPWWDGGADPPPGDPRGPGRPPFGDPPDLDPGFDGPPGNGPQGPPADAPHAGDETDGPPDAGGPSDP